MASTLILSPPTSRANAARSSVVVITFNLPAANPRPAPASSIAAVHTKIVVLFTKNIPISLWTGLMAIPVTSERVRTVRSHGEQKLKQQFVGGPPFAVAGAP